MTIRHLTFISTVLVALTLYTSGAQAETIFPVYGGKGDHTQQYRCPRGQVIVGFSGKTGHWVDRISLTCGRFVAPSYTLAAMKRLHGRGGAGGALNVKDCDLNEAVRIIEVATFDNDSYLYGISFQCFRPVSGLRGSGGVFAGNHPNGPRWTYTHPWTPDFVRGPSWSRPRAVQECPGVEYATGLTIRYGRHVNAAGLICDALIAEGQPAKEWLPGAENMINRPGSDFESFPVASGEPAQCRVACLSWDHKKCAAWTYVKPGIQGPVAMCYLKNAVPAAVRSPCCISGVHPKFKTPTGDPPPSGPNDGDVTREPDGLAPQSPVAPPTPPNEGDKSRERGGVAPPAPPNDVAEQPGAAMPHGKIGEKYAKLGGPNSGIGPALGVESDAPYGGRCHAFRHGTICWHPEIGEAFTVWGAIHNKWVQHRRVEFGYPITDERTALDGRGRYNHFRAMNLSGRPEGSIYWTPQTGAHAIYGLIRDAWAKQGWERGPLGYPTSDEHQDGKFRRSNFERGHILWAPDTGIQVVR